MLFTQYIPEDKELAELVKQGALFCRNADGVCWYDYRQTIPETMTTITVDDGYITSCTKNAELLWPVGSEVFHIPHEQVPEELYDMKCGAGKYVYHDGWIIINREKEVYDFQMQLSQKMKPITSRINFIVEAMEDGDATPEEIAELSLLKQRRTALRRLTPELVESNGWPE